MENTLVLLLFWNIYFFSSLTILCPWQSPGASNFTNVGVFCHSNLVLHAHLECPSFSVNGQTAHMLRFVCHSVCGHYSTRPLWACQRGQDANESTWPCSNKTLLKRQTEDQILSIEQFTDRYLESLLKSISYKSLTNLSIH